MLIQLTFLLVLKDSVDTSRYLFNLVLQARSIFVFLTREESGFGLLDLHQTLAHLLFEAAQSVFLPYFHFSDFVSDFMLADFGHSLIDSDLPHYNFVIIFVIAGGVVTFPTFFEGVLTMVLVMVLRW